MVTVEQIIEKIVETSHCIDGVNSGCECLFLNFDTIGLKLYLSKKVRDNCYYTQEAAYAKDLAPKATNPIYFNLDNIHIYGYFTEIAEVWANLDKQDPRAKKLDKNYDSFMNQLEEVVSKYCLRDLSEWNIGFIGDKPVCIDFGNGGHDHSTTYVFWDSTIEKIKNLHTVLN